MADLEYEYKKHEKITDPLEAAHQIQYLLQDLTPYLNAMSVLGLSCVDDMYFVIQEIRDCAKDCADGICRETNERLKDSQQASANVLSAILSGIKIGEEK